MLQYVKIQNHKGIIGNVRLMDLGHINVICGRNNSGKTSILEGLATTGKYSIGKLVDDANWLCDLVQPMANRFTDPRPELIMQWFREEIGKIISEKTVWYLTQDEINQNIQNLIASQKKYTGLSHFASIELGYVELFGKFFDKIKSWYKPVYIPPKRSLDTVVSIDLKEMPSGNGLGIVNRLFYLKNQDLKSEEFKTYQNIDESFERITDYRFNIFPTKENQLGLCFQGSAQDWRPANDCGLGLSDLLVILTIVLDSDATFYCIEEPENHLHAQYQRRLLSFMRFLGAKQFCLSTHSNVFLDPNNVDRLFYTSYDNEVHVSDQTSKAQMIDSLGYSVTDNLVADVLILCEGPTDVPVLQKMLSWLGLIDKYNIRFWPLGGDIMSQLDLSVFRERKNVVAVIDNDPKSSTIRTRFKRRCKENQIPCYQLERYSIENYFTLDAIKSEVGADLPKKVKRIVPDVSVNEQIGYTSRNKTIKSKNGNIVSRMSLKDIEETDLYKVLKAVERVAIAAKDGAQ